MIQTVRAQRESFRRYLTTVVQPLARLLGARARCIWDWTANSETALIRKAGEKP